MGAGQSGGVARRSCGSPHGAALGVPVRRAGGLGAGAQWGGRARTQGCWCSGLDVIHGAVAASVSCLHACWAPRTPDAGLAGPPRGSVLRPLSVWGGGSRQQGPGQLEQSPPPPRGSGRARPAHVSCPPRACTHGGPAVGSSMSPRVGGSATLDAVWELVQSGSHAAQAGWCGVWTLSNHSCLAQPSGLRGSSYWTSAHIGGVPRLSGKPCSRQSPGGPFCQC